MKRSAFTLLEILVVIGIIALLSALLFPVFNRVREKGRSASCSENLHQVGLAVAVYAQDYDGKFPLGGDPLDLNSNAWSGADGGKWVAIVQTLKPLPSVLSPYVKESKTWRCPSDFGFNHVEGHPTSLLNTHPSSADKWGTSYFYNTRLALMGKTLAGLQAYDNFTPYDTYGADEISVLYDADGNWHGGKGDERRYNVLMADGHVKSQSREQFSTQLSLVFDPPT